MSSNRVGIIFIHGTMGSVLEKKGKKIWPITDAPDNHYINNLTPVSNYIDAVRPLRTYFPLLGILKLSYSNVIDFTYDWRQNNLKHISVLKNDIDSMDVDEIHIIAHSMGGIIAKLCLIEYKDDPAIAKVKKLITLGTPWKGSMDSVKALFYGSRIPAKLFKFIDKDESRKLSLHLPSVYQLLPSTNYLEALRQLNIVPYRFKNKDYSDFTSFFDENLKIDFQKNHDYNDVFQKYFTYLNEDIPENIELHEIIGTGKPTIKNINENSRAEVTVKYDEGDGTVPILSAFSELQNRTNYKSYFVNKASHTFLPGYFSVMKLIKRIIDGRPITPNKIIFDSLNSPFYKKFNGYISKIACPVEISIKDTNGNVIYGNVETISEEEIQKIVQHDYEVESIGTTTYVIFDENDQTNINNFDSLIIDAYDEGLTSVSLEKYENGEIVSRNAFKTFNINTNMQAKLILKDDPEESYIKISDREGSEERLELNRVLLDEDNVTPPETKIKLEGEHLNFLEEHQLFYSKGEITLKVLEIIKGSFEIDKSFLVINGKEVEIESDQFVLDSTILQNGENNIEYFSSDQFDYCEVKKNIKLYYFNENIQKVKVLLDEQSYSVNINENREYTKFADKFNLTLDNPVYFSNDVISDNQFLYSNNDNTIKIEYRDIFQDSIQKTLIIDEKIANDVVKGIATVDEVNTLVEKIGIVDPVYQFHMKKSGNFKLLNESNLLGSYSIDISSSDVEVSIIKNIELEVSFEIMSEYINLDSDIYQYIFKVLDKDQQYVPDLYLQGKLFLNISRGFGQTDKLIIEEFEISFIQESKSYKLDLDMKKIKIQTDEYWNSKEKILNLAKLEIINVKGDAGSEEFNVIRVLEIKIEK